jgi:hypothetical protein
MKTPPTLYAWEPVKAITPAGRAKTICISVDAPDSLYASADGILCHNTAGDPRNPLPPAYIDRRGRMTYLDSVPPEDRDIAAIFAPTLAQPPPDTAKIFAQAPRPVRKAAVAFAEQFDTVEWQDRGALRSQAISPINRIGQEKTINTESPEEFQSTANRYIDIMPGFLGGKWEMALPVTAAIRRLMTPEDRARFTVGVDYFGGGGSWGIYHALTNFDNIQEMIVYERNNDRIGKIRLFHNRGNRVAQLLARPEYQKRLKSVVSKAIQDKVRSGSALANRLKAEPSDNALDKALDQALIDYMENSFAGKKDETGDQTPDAKMQMAVRIVSEQAAKSYAGAVAFRKRGGKITYRNSDSYNAEPLTGDNVMAFVDPPYYLTKGYEFTEEMSGLFGKIEEVFRETIVGIDTYRKTRNLLKRLTKANNGIIYTDSAWWMKPQEGVEPYHDLSVELQKLYNPAGQKILGNIVDFLHRLDVVEGEIGKSRKEVLGIHYGNTESANNGVGRGSRTRPAVKKSTQKGTADRRDDQPRRRDDFALEALQPVAEGTAGQTPPARSGNDRVAPPVPPYYKPPPVDVTATEVERNMAELSRPKPLDIDAEVNKYLAKFQKVKAQMNSAYGQDSINSQRQTALFGDWGASLREDGILFGYRGESTGGGNAFGATEGVGLYIAKNMPTAEFFGKARRVAFPQPQNTLLVDEDAGKDPLPLLREDDDALWTDIFSYKETPGDSDWIKAHKRAARKVGLTNENFGQQTDAFTRALTDELLAMGHDSVLTRSGGEEWVTLLTKPGQRLVKGTRSPQGQEGLYSQQATDARHAELERRAKAGDKEAEAEAQAMVDDAAKAAGFKRGPVYHGTTKGKFDVFEDGSRHNWFSNGVYFTPSLKQSQEYSKYGDFILSKKAPVDASPNVVRAFLKIDKPAIFDDAEISDRQKIWIYNALLNRSERMALDFEEWHESGARSRWDVWHFLSDSNFSGWTIGQGFARDVLQDAGFDGIIARSGNEIYDREAGFGEDTLIVFNPSQIKSADPFTYDDNGKLIPLSERFNPESDSILYSQAADPIERLRELLNQAYADTARGGPRTVGDWTLAHSMDNEMWMASDAYHRETMEKQSNKEWQAIADRILAMDYEGARLGLVAKFAANEHLTPPETKMAETILQREMAQEMTPEQAGRVMVFALGLRRSRAETARTMIAMTDPHRTPMERWRAWMGETLFQPSKKARRAMNKVASEARLQAEIQALRDKIRQIEETLPDKPTADAQAIISKLQARIAELEASPTKESIAASDAAEKLARIEEMLAKKGVTMEDLQKGVVDVRLIGSRLIADVAKDLPDTSRQIIALTQCNRGGTFADIAKKFSITEAEVDKIYEDFRAKLYDATLERIARGIEPDQLADITYNTKKIAAAPDPNAAEYTPEQRRKAMEAVSAMGFAPTADEQKHSNYRSRKSRARGGKKPPGKVKLILMPEWSRPTGEGKSLDVLLDQAKQRGLEWERPTGEGKTRGQYLDLTDNDPYEWQSGRFDPENIEERLPMIREISEAAHGSGWIDYISEYRIANLLSAPTTAITNATAVLYAVWRSIGERAIQAGLNEMRKDKVIDAATFAEFGPFFRALGNNMGRALSNAALAFQTELPVTENMRFHAQQDALSGQFDEHLGRMPGELGRFARIPLRGLMAYDEWLKTLVAQTHAATLAHRMGRARGLTGAKMQRFIETELADPTSSIWEKALNEARRQTFQTKLRSMFESDAKRKSGEFSPLRRMLDAPENFAKMLQSFKQDTGSDAGFISLAAVFMLRWKAPFIKTPFNLLKRGLELTPLSVVVHGYDALGLQRSIASPAAITAKNARKKIARLQKDLRAARTKEAKDRVQKQLDAAKRSFEEARQQIAKDGNKGRLKIPKDEKKILESRAQIIASAIATMVFASISEGDDDDDDKWILLTGTYKPDALATRGGRTLERRTAPPYSLRIGGPGGFLLSYQRIDPFSTAIATVVDATAEMKRAIRSGQAFRPSVVMSGILKQFTERASTQGFADAVDVATGKKSVGAKEIAESIGQSITPNIVRSFLRNSDEYYRDTESFGEDFLAHLVYAMWPSSGTDLPPKLDIYGEPIERPGAFISRYIAPAQPHMQPEYKPGDVTMRNFALQNPELKTWAPEPPSTQDVMRRYNVSAATAYRLNQARGQIFARKLREQRLTNIKRPTASQIDAIRKAHEKSLDDAKKSVGIK